MSDRIVVMNDGSVEQVGTPFEIYNRPRTALRRLLRRHAERARRHRHRRRGRQGARQHAKRSRSRASSTARKSGDTLSLALRPEAISLGRQPGRDASLSGEIAEVHFLGSVIRVRVGIGSNTVSLDTFNNPATPPPAVGEKAEISFSSERHAGAALGIVELVE